MKKACTFILLLLLVNPVGVLSQEISSFMEAIGRKNKPALTRERELWLLALPAVIMELNHSSHTTLPVEIINARTKAKWIKVLKDWWNVGDREELIETIRQMEYHGHNETFCALRDLSRRESGKGTGEIIVQYGLTEPVTGYFRFIREHQEDTGDLDILSWDLGRMTSLIRWGYQCGYLTEAEAWWMLLYFGRKIKSNYRSWREYGAEYFLGRVFWAAGFGGGEEYLKETREVLKKLLAEDGLWGRLAWDIEL